MGTSDDTAADLNLNVNFRVSGGECAADPAAAPNAASPASGPHPGLRGVFIPLVTPFTPDAEHVDLDALTRLAHETLDHGAAGIVALGTTAEAASLTPPERHAVAAACARVCAERGVPLVVGIGTNDTRRAADELAALPALVTDAGTAHDLGAGDLGDAPDAADTAPGPLAAALVPVPYYTRPSEDGVVAHFAHLARRSPVPLLVYHIPYRTGRPLSADTLRRLARLPGVVGVKLAVGGIDQATVEFLADCTPAVNHTEPAGPAGPAGPADLSDPSDTAIPPGFAVLAGDDMFCAPLLALGAAGGILASAHIATSVFADLATAWDRGETARACALGHALTGLSAALFAEPNPVVIKAVLAAQGRIPSAAVRLPLLPATPAAVDRALAALTTTEHTAATHVPA